MGASSDPTVMKPTNKTGHPVAEPVERRGCVVRPWPLANWKREEPVDEAKPFKIPNGKSGKPSSV